MMQTTRKERKTPYARGRPPICVELSVHLIELILAQTGEFSIKIMFELRNIRSTAVLVLPPDHAVKKKTNPRIRLTRKYS